MKGRRIAAALAVPVMLIAALAASPRNPVGYLVRQGYFQMELLYGRVPLDEAAASGIFDDKELETLSLVPEIKTFGASIDLAATDNYDTINPTWNRTIYNVSASEPLRFQNKTWWFPIVGTMPYLGFFRRADAGQLADRLSSAGYDVYVRTAGAYSTLGWFQDPLLPKMLKWKEYRLADTLLHELAHATLWIPGSVQFNESFANFVGEVAAERYLIHKYGADSKEVRYLHTIERDRKRYRTLLRTVFKELDTLYKRPDLPDGDKIVRKQAVLAGIPTRVLESDLERKSAYYRAAARSTWNNARFMQFRTYNRSSDWFRTLYEQEGEDLNAFIARIDEITRNGGDPYTALAHAVGADPSDRRKPYGE